MIVRMQHLDLVCVASAREATLERLRALGAVHLDLSAACGAAVASAQGEIDEAEKAVRLVVKARGKDFRDEVRPRTVGDVLALDADRATLVAERERLEREIKVYEPYGDFDPALAKKLAEKGIRLVLNKDGSFSISGQETASPFGGQETASPFGGQETASPFGDTAIRLPEIRLSKMREKLARVVNRINVDTAKIAGADEKAILAQYPALRAKMEFEQAKELMSEKGAVCLVSGWMPETRIADFRSQIAKEGWGVLLREPAEGETPPTLIEPPKAFRPVKALFEGLGIAPGYTEADVSVPFLCYFSLFFAMLVGDGAYGAIFLVATLVGWRKWGKQRNVRSSTSGQETASPFCGQETASPFKSWLVLMTVFSLATIAWGFLSDTWFGANLLQVKTADGVLAARWTWAEHVLGPARWLSGADAPAGHQYDNMMFLCFTIGVSHLMLARLWNGICTLNDRSCLSQFGWAGIVLFMYVLTNAIVGIFGGVPTWCYWMFGASFLVVFWQAKGMDKGMLFLNAMSVLGDIISYVRLFAVGLASVKVAENFNAMAIDLGLPIWIKWLPLVLILLVGHGLNLAMAGLSVLVHAVRLNTLEFSNHKGISWAGYAFRPFGRKS